MKGVVFNLLEETVTDQFGAAVWEEILERAQGSGVYTALGSYDDAELIALVGAAAARLDMGADEILTWFGERSLPRLAASYPTFFSQHAHTIPFVLTLNDIIHPEVRKLYPGADVPDFDFERPDASTLLLGYRSARRMCAFAEGLLRGAAAHFGEKVEIAHVHCMKRGDDRCVLECRFTAG